MDIREEVVSKLNNAMEEDHEFWEEEMCCQTKEIVKWFGFGYVPEKEEIYYCKVDDITHVSVPTEQIKKLLDERSSAREIRSLILWLYIVSEK